MLLSKIDTLIQRIKKHRPLNAGELRSLRESLRVTEVYNSNALEGNTLTLGETQLVITDGITIGGKTVREMHEAVNLSQALEMIVTQKNPLDESTTCRLHAMIMRGIDDENGGQYRRIQVYISGDAKKLPTADKVSKYMNELFLWYQDSKDSYHPVTLAGEFHYRYVKIHPFLDGNGRTARLLSNMILMMNGYPLVTIPVIRRAEYISSLHSETGSLTLFQDFYADVVHENLKDYVRMIA